MANYTRNMQNVQSTTDLQTMATKYTNMLNAVANMVATDGPIYNVWITFQIGKSNPITFNSASTNPKENLIASLHFDKTGADIANSFELDVQYDPFGNGQNPTDKIEALDDCVARAMSYDFDAYGNTKGNLKAMRGTIQYGYNTTTDTNLVSPKYTFIITDIQSDVKVDSGITTYTFKGTSELSSDCDNSTSFGQINNWRMLDIVEWTLYYWYGDADHKPSHTGDAKPTDNPYKYRIDIPDDVYEAAKETVISVDATSGVTPWQYCSTILDNNPLTDEERKSGEYDNLAELSYNQKPRYSMFITDEDGVQTIHVSHIKPVMAKTYEDTLKKAEKSTLQIDYTFTWGKKLKQNIVIGWKPEVNLKVYLIRKALYLRRQAYLAQLEESGDTEALEKAKQDMAGFNDDLNEIYDATLEIVGIPATPPINSEVRIIPRVLESESRQAGFYRIVKCSDDISTAGVYVTTLSLIRVRGLNDATVSYTSQEEAKEKQQYKTDQATLDNYYKGGFVGVVSDPNKSYRDVSTPSWSGTHFELKQ